jgi:hypothetical protein
MLTNDERPLEYEYVGKTLTVKLPASRRTQLVDVVRVELADSR